MASDAHAHPYCLAPLWPEAEAERKRNNIRCAASAFRRDEFLYNEALSPKNGVPACAPCFAVHPQLPAENLRLRARGSAVYDVHALLYVLEDFARQGRLRGVGELGFDLYNAEYRATEKEQTSLFKAQLEIARAYALPLVLHLRRAAHKVFEYKKELRRLPAVVFHSFCFPPDFMEAVLRHRINGYFSFGSRLYGHKNARLSAAAADGGRLLFETDAPYQSVNGKAFSVYGDIFGVINEAAELRRRGAAEIEAASDSNWTAVFGGGL
ncbi:MAG: TatD family hydrolase [Spirochaetaceae bacterium]|nr:TatD family hydrolase [Spirochaetaceae bacterium]